MFAASDGNGVFAYLIVLAFMVWGIKKASNWFDGDGTIKSTAKEGFIAVLKRKLQ